MLSGLLELQRLKRLERTGWTLRGMPNGTESVAAHSFGVTVTAMFLADELRGKKVEIQIDRVLRMALVHDWAEVRVGDMPRTALTYFGAAARKTAESSAFADLAQNLSRGDLYRELYEEYEQRQTLEARLVKAADTIDLLIQALALERAGARGLDEFWEAASEPDFQLEGQASELVINILESIREERKMIRDL